MRLTLPALTLLCTLPAAAMAADAGVTVLNLSANASQELANDEINASLYVQDRQPQANTLADRINKALNRARQDAEAYRKVTFSSGSYNTWPDYDKNGKIIGWQARAEVKLRSSEFADTAELIARLQKYMALEGVQFGVSDRSRSQAEAQLIPQAIAALQAQATAAGKALGKHQQQVTELSIGSAQPHYPVMMRAKAEMAAAPAADIAPVNFQPGQSVIQLNINGKVEIR